MKFQNKSSTAIGRVFVIGCHVSLFSVMLGCSEEANTPSLAKGTATQIGNQPVPSSNVNRIQAWKDASTVAGKKDGGVALVGGGDSMNPIYGDNTMLVVKPIDYNDLKQGMVVVFINKYGRRVAHVLIKKVRAGWIAQGYNNPKADSDLVTPDNLVGFVYASMSSDLK